MEGLTVRPATAADLPAVNAVYNHYVATSTTTYQTTPTSAADRAAWFARHDGLHPVVVADRNGQVVGWGALSPFHARQAYRFTVEDSIYIRHDQRRLGIGRALLQDLLDRGRAIGHHAVVAVIDAEQSASIALHESEGFTQVGRLHQVGRKFDRWLDVIYMQLLLNGR